MRKTYMYTKSPSLICIQKKQQNIKNHSYFLCRSNFVSEDLVNINEIFLIVITEMIYILGENRT